MPPPPLPLQAAIKKFNGFGPAVIEAVVRRREALFKPELYALLQALLGLVSKPSDGPPVRDARPLVPYLP